MNRKLLALIAISITAFSFPTNEKITVYLIGDSTMCNYEPNRAPLTGWGMPFASFFDSTVSIDNRARGGRSTRTFIAENRWQPIAIDLKEGDYLFIQFGHNDEAREEKYKDRYTPVPDYKKNLLRFITEAREKKAVPVLITPVSRLRFKDGVAQETHTGYTKAMFEVAQSNAVVLIDLDTKSRELYQQLGPDAAKLLFMQLEPGEHPAYPEGQKDNTHFNEYGARRIAQLVLASVKEQLPQLAEKTVQRVAKH